MQCGGPLPHKCVVMRDAFFSVIKPNLVGVWCAGSKCGVALSAEMTVTVKMSSHWSSGVFPRSWPALPPFVPRHVDVIRLKTVHRGGWTPLSLLAESWTVASILERHLMSSHMNLRRFIKTSFKKRSSCLHRPADITAFVMQTFLL